MDRVKIVRAMQALNRSQNARCLASPSDPMMVVTIDDRLDETVANITVSRRDYPYSDRPICRPIEGADGQPELHEEDAAALPAFMRSQLESALRATTGEMSDLEPSDDPDDDREQRIAELQVHLNRMSPEQVEMIAEAIQRNRNVHEL